MSERRDLGWVVGGNAVSRAQNYIPKINELASVPPFYIEYEYDTGRPAPYIRPRLIQIKGATVDTGFVPVLQCYSYDDDGERRYRLDKIMSVLDARGIEQPLGPWWMQTLGVEWPRKW